MPAVTQQHQEPLIHAGKKRRRDDDNHDAQQPHPPTYEGFFRLKQTSPPLLDPYPTNAYLDSPTTEQQDYPNHNNVYHHAATRKHFPLPTPKRLREAPAADSRPHSRFASPNLGLRSPPREQLREASSSSPNTARRPVPDRHDSTTLLSRCHICHRKPARKSDLDSFGDCEGCGQRTCFVCLRECLDWRTEEQKRWSGYGSASFGMRDVDDPAVARERGEEEIKRLKSLLGRTEGGQREGREGGWKSGGHRKKICSRCCVERGPDGDVVCLGCLPFVEG